MFERDCFGLVNDRSPRFTSGVSRMRHISRILLTNILKIHSPVCVLLFALVSPVNWCSSAPRDLI